MSVLSKASRLLIILWVLARWIPHISAGFYSEEVDEKDSRRLKVLINGTWVTSTYPPPPHCGALLTQKVPPIPIALHIWKVDMSLEEFTGYIYWSEVIENSCASYFFGDTLVTTKRTVLAPYEAPLSKLNRTFLDTIEYEDPRVLIAMNEESICSWMRTVDHVHKRVMGVRSKIFFNPDGSIAQPWGNWRRLSNLVYSDGFKTIVFDSLDISDLCPLKIFRTVPAFIAAEPDDPHIITSPEANLLLSLDPKWSDLACTTDTSIPIFKTMGGYFISMSTPSGTVLQHPDGLKEVRSDHVTAFKDNVSKHRAFKRSLSYPVIDPEYNMETGLKWLQSFHKMRTPRHIFPAVKRTPDWSKIFDAGMRNTFDYASYRYSMDSILNQDTSALRSMQFSICQNLLLQWSNLSPPDLAPKVARYQAQSHMAFGVFNEGQFGVMTPTIATSEFHLIQPLHHYNGMFQIMENATGLTMWLEPVTGRTFRIPIWTLYSLSAQWVPTIDGNQYFPFEDRVVVVERSFRPLKTSKMPSASRQITIYHQGESPSISWANMVVGQTSTSPHWIPPTWMDTAMSYAGHILAGVIVWILITALIPSCINLCSCLRSVKSPEQSSYFRVR